MPRKTATLALVLASATSVLAESESPIPGFDFSRTAFTHSSGMDFDDGNGPGELQINRFEIRSLLSQPINPASGITILPLAQYSLTQLDFQGIPAGLPLTDEELHSISTSAILIGQPEGSPWIYGAWARAEMAGDFQQIDGDDFTFDLAGGAGYKFSDRFTLAAGVAALNLNGNTELMVGPAFDWRATDTIRVGLYGPNFTTTWSPCDSWKLSFKTQAAGGLWNIDSNTGESRNVELDSYRIGLQSDHRLSENIWLEIGAGVTTSNEVRLLDTSDRTLYKRDMDDGWYSFIGLRLTDW